LFPDHYCYKLIPNLYTSVQYTPKTYQSADLEYSIPVTSFFEYNLIIDRHKMREQKLHKNDVCVVIFVAFVIRQHFINHTLRVLLFVFGRHNHVT